jgi:DNA polymerase III epsilon subunit-like protein
MDCETTGLKPGYIAQFSAVKVLDGKITGWNAWFKVPEMSEGASKANGLTVPLLDKLSEGKDFFDRLDCLDELFQGVKKIYGYNTRFDRNFLETEFARCSLPLPDVEFHDVMGVVKADMNVTKGYKLTDAVRYYDVEDNVTALTEKLFEVTGDAHDARWDAVATLLVGRKLNVI